MILNRSPSVTAHDAPPKPLPPHVPYAIRAKREAALRKALDGPVGHPNQKHQGGQSDRRKGWASRLPEGKFSLQDAAAAWGIDTHGAQGRLEVLAMVELLGRTELHVRPVVWWRRDG